MKLKQLESALSNLKSSFPSPNIQLEQYPTSAHLAAAIALTAYKKGDVRIDKISGGCRICDLGCGTGMLSLAFALILNDLAEQYDDSDDDDNEKGFERKRYEHHSSNKKEEEDLDDDNYEINEHFGEIVGIDVCDEALLCAQENKDLLLELELLEENTPRVDFMHAELKYDPSLHESRSSNINSHPHGGGEGRRKGRGSRDNAAGHYRRTRGRGQKNARGKADKNHEGKLHQEPHSNVSIPSKGPISLPYSTTFHSYNDLLPFPSHSFDMVVTNPPFGTKHNEGIDIAFLAAACRLSKTSVYSFHKSSTRPYLIKLIEHEWREKFHCDLGIEIVAQMKFEIPNMYKFHKEKSVDVDVDLIRVYHKTDPCSFLK